MEWAQRQQVGLQAWLQWCLRVRHGAWQQLWGGHRPNKVQDAGGPGGWLQSQPACRRDGALKPRNEAGHRQEGQRCFRIKLVRVAPPVPPRGSAQRAPNRGLEGSRWGPNGCLRQGLPPPTPTPLPSRLVQLWGGLW